MLTIVYDPENGDAFADGKAEDTVKWFIDCVEKVGQHRAVVSTFNVVDAARALIAEEVIDHTRIEFEFKGQKIPHSPSGKLTSWPMEFGALQTEWLRRINTANRARNRP